jgi:probable addiction module antidote protein
MSLSRGQTERQHPVERAAEPAGDAERLRKSLDAALATNDLQQICRAVDANVLQGGCVSELARTAGIDRTTLYRAFRWKKGPALHTMIRVLEVLGLQLEVDVRKGRSRKVPDLANARARLFSAAFRSGKAEALYSVFNDAVREQENVAAFAQKVNITREAIYRIFTGPQTPRLGTVVSLLKALDLRLVLTRPAEVRRSLDTDQAFAPLAAGLRAEARIISP